MLAANKRVCSMHVLVPATFNPALNNEQEFFYFYVNYKLESKIHCFLFHITAQWSLV